MKRQTVLLASIALMLGGAMPLATAADAAVIKHHRHHLVRASAHDEGGYVDATNRGHERRGGWVGRGWTAENSTSDRGWMESYYNGYGSYRGQPGDICGTIEWTIGLCGPHGP